MKNKSGLTQDEFRQKVDGFSVKDTEEKSEEGGYKIVDMPIYQTHSADFDDIENKERNQDVESFKK